jgi:hypothetical protein
VFYDIFLCVYFDVMYSGIQTGIPKVAGSIPTVSD